MMHCSRTPLSLHGDREGQNAGHSHGRGPEYLHRYAPPLWKFHNNMFVFKYPLAVYMNINAKCWFLPLSITLFNTLPIHTGKVVHSPSTHWILWEPFIRNLGLQTYSTTSLCWYSPFCVSLTSPLRSWGGGAQDFTCPAVEILCK